METFISVELSPRFPRSYLLPYCPGKSPILSSTGLRLKPLLRVSALYFTALARLACVLS